MFKLTILLLITIPIQKASASSCQHFFTIGTQNLWHYPYSYQKRLKNLIDNTNNLPDILGLQEAWTSFSRSLFWELADEVNHNYFFTETNKWPGFNEGLAIKTSFKILQKKYFELPYSKWKSKRVAQLTLIQLLNKKIWVINTHLSPFNFNKERIAQVEFIFKKIMSLPSNDTIFLIGDLNAEMESGIFDKLLNHNFKSVQAINPMTTYSKKNKFTDGKYNSAIDHIFYRAKGVKYINSNLIFNKKLISDHYGLSAQFCY